MISPHHIQQAVERTQQALIIAQYKPSPRGQGGGSSNVEPPMPLPAGVISAKRELRDMLLDWVGLVSEGLAVVAHCDPTEPSMLAWLGSGERADYLAAHEAAQDFLEELTEVTKALENPYLPRAGKKYLGYYGGGDVYVRDGQQEVTLANGEVHRVETIKTHSANHVLEWTGTAQEVSRAIKDYFGHDITPKQVQQAQKDDKRRGNDNGLVPVSVRGREYVYRVRDVLNRIKLKEKSQKT